MARFNYSKHASATSLSPRTLGSGHDAFVSRLLGVPFSLIVKITIDYITLNYHGLPQTSRLSSNDQQGLVLYSCVSWRRFLADIPARLKRRKRCVAYVVAFEKP